MFISLTLKWNLSLVLHRGVYKGVTTNTYKCLRDILGKVATMKRRPCFVHLKMKKRTAHNTKKNGCLRSNPAFVEWPVSRIRWIIKIKWFGL